LAAAAAAAAAVAAAAAAAAAAASAGGVGARRRATDRVSKSHTTTAPVEVPTARRLPVRLNAMHVPRASGVPVAFSVSRNCSMVAITSRDSNGLSSARFMVAGRGGGKHKNS